LLKRESADATGVARSGGIQIDAVHVGLMAFGLLNIESSIMRFRSSRGSAQLPRKGVTYSHPKFLWNVYGYRLYRAAKYVGSGRKGAGGQSRIIGYDQAPETYNLNFKYESRACASAL
jgi:hypothetical protein